MRRLALAALGRYGFPEARLVLLSHEENALFRVELTGEVGTLVHPYLGRLRNQSFVLRVQGIEGYGSGSVRAELMWLAALLRDTELIVPEPVPDANGALVSEVSVEGVPGIRQCVLLRWTGGHFPETGKGERLVSIHELGAYMAELHRHASSYSQPAILEQHGPGRDFPEGDPPVMDPRKIGGLEPGRGLEAFEATARRIREEMLDLGESNEMSGVLAAADPHKANYLFQDGQVRAIEPGDGGIGYFLFDIVVALRKMKHLSDYAALREAFIRGYRGARPLHPDHEVEIDTYMATDQVDLANWILNWPNSSNQQKRSLWRLKQNLDS